MADYVQKVQGLQLILNHSELFLQYNQEQTMTDHKTRMVMPGEHLPFLTTSGISMHSVYPYVFETLAQRNHYKLEILQQARERGQNFYFKGTLGIVETADEFIDFFSDRQFVITKRRDTLAQLMSFVFAQHHRQFIVKHNNPQQIDTLRANTAEPCVITVREPVIRSLIQQTQKLYQLEQLLIARRLDYTVVYYEDINSWDHVSTVVGKILGCADWQRQVPDLNRAAMPMDTQLQYSPQLIANYQQVKQQLTLLIEEYQFRC